MSSSRVSPIPLLKIRIQEKGRIKDIKEIIVRADGLRTCLNGQIVDMGEGVKGMIMGFNEEDVFVLVLGDPARLRMGREITGISEPFSIPVGEGFVGRMVDALGRPLDGRGEVEAAEQVAVLKQSLPITARAPLTQFLPTGTRFVDAMVPIAKGQRQLILGDRITGKTSIAIDAILNQKGRDCFCIYCCIGKSLSGLEKAVSTLHDWGALHYTVIMAAVDNAPAGEQYLVPFSAAAMGEYFVARGRDVLVVFDDLTKHAWAYRQLSLLLERPPGREAYPGDIFYVQTQLMERAGRFNDAYGGGSMTFLCIAETLQSDLTGYIPSNLVSMCDGQIFMSSGVFAEGMRPAIDLQLSLSILGNRVQPPILRDLSAGVRVDFARFLEIMRFSRLQTSVSGESQRLIAKGKAILALLQQAQNAPSPIPEQVILLHALSDPAVLSLSQEDLLRFRGGIYDHARDGAPELIRALEVAVAMTDRMRQDLSRLVAGFLRSPAMGGEAPAPGAGGPR